MQHFLKESADPARVTRLEREERGSTAIGDGLEILQTRVGFVR